MATTITTNPDGGRTRRAEENDGSWRVSTYNAAGLLTRFENSQGHWRIYTYNDAGQNTHYENSDKYRRTRTYNAAGQETSYEDNDGKCITIAHSGEYLLQVSATAPHIYWAGCRKFTREQAIEHWGSPRKDNIDRAAAFLAAVISHKEN